MKYDFLTEEEKSTFISDIHYDKKMLVIVFADGHAEFFENYKKEDIELWRNKMMEQYKGREFEFKEYASDDYGQTVIIQYLEYAASLVELFMYYNIDMDKTFKILGIIALIVYNCMVNLKIGVMKSLSRYDTLRLGVIYYYLNNYENFLVPSESGESIPIYHIENVVNDLDINIDSLQEAENAIKDFIGKEKEKGLK